MPASPPSPPPKASRVKTVRKTLADGSVREYRYDRETRARIPDPNAPARRKLVAAAPKGVLALTAAYRRSTEFGKLAPRTQGNHERELEWLEKLGEVDPRSVRRPHLLGLRDMITRKRGSGAANVFLSVMSTVFDWALQRELVDLNPASGAKRLEGGELPPWTEVEARLAMAPGEVAEPVRRAIVLAYYIIRASGEVTSARWSGAPIMAPRSASPRRRRPSAWCCRSSRR